MFWNWVWWSINSFIFLPPKWPLPLSSGLYCTSDKTGYVYFAVFSKMNSKFHIFIQNTSLAYHTSYKREELLPIVEQLNTVVQRAPRRKLKTIYDKYSHENFFKVKVLLLLNYMKLFLILTTVLKQKFRLPKAWNPSHLSQTTPSKWTWASPNRILNSSLQLNYIITTDKARYKCSTTQPVSPLCMCKSESAKKSGRNFGAATSTACTYYAYSFAFRKPISCMKYF